MLRNHESNSDPTQKQDYVPSSSSYHGFQNYPAAYSYQGQGHDSMVYVLPSDSNESPNGEQATKNAGSRWREDETEALVEIWRDKICQTRWWKQSKGVRVNKEMWEEIAQLLAERDVYRTPSQCQIRMKNLLQFYRQTVDNRRSEKSMEDLPEYFDIVDSIMTRRENNLSMPEDKTMIDIRENTSPDVNNNEVDQKRSFREVGTTQHGGVEANEKEENKFEPERKRRFNDYNNKYNTNLYPSFPQNRSSNLIDENHAHVRWQGSNGCCERTSPQGKANTVIDADCLPRHPDMFYPRRFVQMPNPYTRQSSTIQDRKFKSNHVCNPTDGFNMQSCSSQQNHSAKLTSESDWHVCNSNSSIRFIQELLNLQYKQMENFLEIEKKRLDVEEKRLHEERESYSRNTAFLMEAVKILAESFRKNEPVKNED